VCNCAAGHSSWSSSALCFITWWLLDRLRVFDGSGHPWRLVAAAMPAMAAVAVGISRYVDYWHHASDVAAGTLHHHHHHCFVAGGL
jgi:diacylglycerol diphosphate phosphatase/phosphatidate phosphatase